MPGLAAFPNSNLWDLWTDVSQAGRPLCQWLINGVRALKELTTTLE